MRNVFWKIARTFNNWTNFEFRCSIIIITLKILIFRLLFCVCVDDRTSGPHQRIATLEPSVRQVSKILSLPVASSSSTSPPPAQRDGKTGRYLYHHPLSLALSVSLSSEETLLQSWTKSGSIRKRETENGSFVRAPPSAPIRLLFSFFFLNNSHNRRLGPIQIRRSYRSFSFFLSRL